MTDTAYLIDILALLLAAITVVPGLQRLHVPAVLGYLAAGVLIGPHVLALIQGIESTRIVSEFGVVALLFAIGLDMPLARLKAMRQFIFGLGLLQVAATSVVIGLAAHYVFGTSPAAALVIGGALALSSTATVLKLLVER